MTEARTNEEVIQEFRDAGGISADMVKAITPDALEIPTAAELFEKHYPGQSNPFSR